MTPFEKPTEDIRNGSTPPPSPFNDIDFDAIIDTVNREVLAERPFGGPKKTAEIYDFSTGSDAETVKAQAQEARSARLENDQKAADKIREEIRKAA